MLTSALLALTLSTLVFAQGIPTTFATIASPTQAPATTPAPGLLGLPLPLGLSVTLGPGTAAISGTASLLFLGGDIAGGLGKDGLHGHIEGTAGPNGGLLAEDLGPSGFIGCAGGVLLGFAETACLPLGQPTATPF